MMQAMILAAGLGTRLRPLTLVRPKPLVPVLNRPLLGLILDRLAREGFTRVAVNTHHLPERISAYLDARPYGGMDIRVFHEPAILGTGGGIKNTASYWDRRFPLLVINADVVTDISPAGVYEEHRHGTARVSLVMHDYERFNQVTVNREGKIVGFKGADGELEGSTLMAFTGIQVMDPAVLDAFPPGTSHSIDTYTRMIAQGEPIRALKMNGCVWTDVGSVPDYLRVHREVIAGDIRPERIGVAVGEHGVVGEGSRIGSGARLEGWNSIGASAVIGEGALVRNSVLWDNVTIEAGAEVIDCVVADGAYLSGRCRNSVVHGEVEHHGAWKAGV